MQQKKTWEYEILLKYSERLCLVFFVFLEQAYFLFGGPWQRLHYNINPLLYLWAAVGGEFGHEEHPFPFCTFTGGAVKLLKL